MDININWPGEKLVIKLWETLADKGIGSLLKPGQIRREGKAIAEVQAESMRVIAQAEKDVQDIRFGGKVYTEGKLLTQLDAESQVNSSNQTTKIEPYIDPNYLIQEVANNNIKEAIQKEINLSKALLVTEATLASDPQEPSEAKVDDDWLYRWRDYAGGVSTEELQSLWGNILAGEIKSPGQFSYRTLDFLRNLSKEDANKISILANYVFSGFIYKGNTEFLDSKGITFNYLLNMQELGIVSGVESNGIVSTYSSASKDEFILNLKYHDRLLQISHKDSLSKFTLTGYAITTLGNQVFSLGNFERDDSYLEIIGNYIKSQGFSVDIAEIIGISENIVKFTNKKAL